MPNLATTIIARRYEVEQHCGQYVVLRRGRAEYVFDDEGAAYRHVDEQIEQDYDRARGSADRS